MKRGTIIVAEADVTPVLRAIEAACERMQSIHNAEPITYAKAGLEELGKIAQAKAAYDHAISASLRRNRGEPEQIHAPAPLVLR